MVRIESLANRTWFVDSVFPEAWGMTVSPSEPDHVPSANGEEVTMHYAKTHLSCLLLAEFSHTLEAQG